MERIVLPYGNDIHASALFANITYIIFKAETVFKNDSFVLDTLFAL